MKYLIAVLVISLGCCVEEAQAQSSHGSTSYEVHEVSGGSHGSMRRGQQRRAARRARRAAHGSHGSTSYGSHGSVSYAAPPVVEEAACPCGCGIEGCQCQAAAPVVVAQPVYVPRRRVVIRRPIVAVPLYCPSGMCHK